MLFLGKNVSITLHGKNVDLLPEDVQIEREIKPNIVAMNEDDMAIALDTNINEELFMEGLAREIVNKINTMRKEQDFDVVDRIEVTMQTTAMVEKSYLKFKNYIDNEILAIKFEFAPCQGEEKDLSGEMATIIIKKH
jgi:isoleucyl-tRNA synthetase